MTVAYNPPTFTDFAHRIAGDPINAGYDLDRAIQTAFQSIYSVQNQVTAQASSLTPTTVSVNSTYSASGNQTIFGSTAIAGFTVYLPLANSVTAGTVITVKKVSTDGNTLTVQRSGTNLIDGASTWTTATAYASARFQSDGSSNWFIV